MKLSLRWLADHFTSEWRVPSISKLQRLLIQHTAEIDDAYEVHIPCNHLYAGLVHEHTAQEITVFIPELNQTYTLAYRDIPFPDSWYLVYIGEHDARWVTTRDVGGSKEHIFPAVRLDDHAAHTGEWRSALAEHDVIIDIDNAAITHRSDLWGHAGFAREIAAIMQTALAPTDALYCNIPVRAVASDDTHAFQPHIHADACDRFVSYYIPQLDAHPSAVEMAARLARVGVRPHNLLVDITNYVMYDIGQPMHVFDAAQLPEQELAVRYAHDNEQMQALDGTQVVLNHEDMVVTSGDTPLSVAGIIGGDTSGVQGDTRSIVLEAAHFHPAAIRRTSARIKRRTESSMRFEKDVDPYKTDLAIQRYMALLNEHGISCNAAECAYAAGAYPELPHIYVTHAFLEQRIGLSVPEDRVVDILRTLGCQVTAEDAAYQIAVPSFRRTDLQRPEDIVEEIARIVGYDHIPLRLPYRSMYPRNVQASARVQTIKQHCAYALSMREIVTYALYDELWLNELNWTPDHAVTIANPVSENMYRLVTSLVPHVLHAVARNAAQNTKMRFFEWGKAWRLQDDNIVQEDECLTGIIYDKHKTYDFYQIKSELHSLFQLLNMQVSWRNVDDASTLPAWYDPDVTARVLYAYNGDWYDLGYIGKVHADIAHRIASGAMYVFELDGDALRAYKAPHPIFYGMSKYQSTWFDVSAYVPQHVTVADLESCVQSADEHVHDVYLVDVYENAPDPYVRSVSLRVVAGSYDHTLSKDEIEQIHHNVQAAVSGCDGKVR